MAGRDVVPLRIEVPDTLAASAGRLLGPKGWRPLAVDAFGQSSSEYVGEIESVEAFPEFFRADPLNRTSRHMLDLEIFDRLDGYARGAVDRGDLELWLEEETWDEPLRYATRLAADVLRLMAECDHGDFSQKELRQRVWRLIEPRRGTRGITVGDRIEPAIILDGDEGVWVRPVAAEDLARIAESAPQAPISQRYGIDIRETSRLATR